MFRSLHMKLVLILVLMIVSVMAVVGTFLINSVNTFYLDNFYEQMQSVFTGDTILSLEEAAAESGADGLITIIDAHRSRLGIDDYRNYYILDNQGRFLDGSNPNITLTRTSSGETCPRYPLDAAQGRWVGVCQKPAKPGFGMKIAGRFSESIRAPRGIE